MKKPEIKRNIRISKKLRFKDIQAVREHLRTHDYNVVMFKRSKKDIKGFKTPGTLNKTATVIYITCWNESIANYEAAFQMYCRCVAEYLKQPSKHGLFNIAKLYREFNFQPK